MDHVDIRQSQYKVAGESEKAILVRFDTGKMGGVSTIWLPKSAARETTVGVAGSTSVLQTVLRVDGWLATRERLDRFCA